MNVNPLYKFELCRLAGQKVVSKMEYLDKQRVSSPILLQGFANSDKPESNPNKHLSDERKLQTSVPGLSPLTGGREAASPRDGTPSPVVMSPSQQSPRLSSSPSTPTSAHSLAFANPFNLAGRPFLPPGLNPFFPHGVPLLPGNFPRFPPDPRVTAALFDASGAGKGYPGRPGWPGGLGGPPQKRPMDLEDDIGMTMDQKKLRLQSSMRMLKDEPVPEGYSRFR